MTVEITSIFAVPFVQHHFEGAEQLNRDLSALFLQREASCANPDPSLPPDAAVFESDFNLFQWPDSSVQRLKQMCWQVLGATIAELNGYSDAAISALRIGSHAWFHLTREGGSTTLHTHPMASWSGVYCVSPGDSVAARPDSGVLRFHNPHHFSNYFLDHGNRTLRPPYHHGSWNVPLRAGSLVLFPSWLQHEVMTYFGQRERITVAFNCWFTDA